MSNKDSFLEIWEYDGGKCTFDIPPDGCRDIIFSAPQNKPLNWHIFDLAETNNAKIIDERIFMRGIRLRPGAIINYTRLKEILAPKPEMTTSVTCDIISALSVDISLDEALIGLGEYQTNIKTISKNLGLSMRSLQRLVGTKTGKPPQFWRSLARARNTARTLFMANEFAQISLENNYSDQSHCTRDMIKWFDKTPSQIAKAPSLHKLLCSPAYF